VFVPDGPLHRINPETLVSGGAAPRYWIEDVTVLMAPSLSVLAEGAGADGGRRRAEPSLLVIGDPLAAGDEFPRLSHAAREVSGIAGHFAAAQRSVFTGERAQPAAYLESDPSRFDLIHFAAHATANAEVPLESAVILSPGSDSSKLYARDILHVPIRAELVTISSCRAAGSRAYAGEGLVGLTWAFLSAGARTVIAGLWNVEDASTSTLMDVLYEGLRGGEDPAAALRRAKLSLLRAPGAYRKPFYWAPFVVFTRSGGAADVRSRT
jgi:CHAT domain-containing protein